MTVAEGGGRRAVSKKLQDIYLPALKANWMIWPLVQILNFRVIPLPFQIVSVLLYLLTSRLKVIVAFANAIPAIRILRRYRLDGILVTHQFK
jgi:Mpv17 / PMP22 family